MINAHFFRSNISSQRPFAVRDSTYRQSTSPSTPTMAVKFTIQEVLAEDFAPELAQLERLILHDEPIGRVAFGPQHASAEANSRRIAQITAVPEGSTNRFTKAVDENGRTVGAAFWNLRTDPWAVNEADGVIHPERFPPGANLEVIEAAFGKASRNRVRNMGGKKCATLNILLVLPELQRRGIGSALMAEGLQRVDEQSLPMWVGASKFGLGLYLKHGFVVDETWEVDLTPYGEDSVETQTCMLRAPQSLAKP